MTTNVQIGSPCFTAALRYLARGWSVVPLCPPDHQGIDAAHQARCQRPGKCPLLLWTVYQRRLPTAKEIHAWWQRWPSANVGVVYGPVSNLMGIDIDGPAGWKRFLEMIGGESQRPDTLEFSTPAGGYRLLFPWPAQGVPNRSLKTPDGSEALRFQGERALTVMPPSKHINGGEYQWTIGCRPEEVDQW